MRDMDEVTILPMQDGDLDQVTQIEKEIFPTPWTRRQFQFEIRNHYCHYFVAKIGDVVIGYTGLVVVGSEGYITNLAVKAEHRRKGLGTRMILTIFRKALEAGVDIISLEVRKSNLIAQELYRQFEFHQGGVRRRYYVDNREDALVMSTGYITAGKLREIIEKNEKYLMERNLERQS
ncbi:[ribosomal protein S18]-alanine N-acetyltransferase [Candidatus Hakubella thermalkaliphila]|uniref:[ribosomal protein S18]-alanine N-acetyltransferase n=2 Tax=Candidatus Hakubella thermalkaliphila TaxID=2754717 RepID=A0A6V8QBP7_9ACTN|nr:Ribosomal-protein-alanine acetyltransferase [Actinomycetota bacterium]GFP26598.1 [ribosomal protein S18]-alanine N-acetyltransferase [Candidatus Hakubella thermalkaliphila]GFP34598.1 [ribosomal protein S18]-alanine N-acetyltransferase [Candidatus Hakubella thermalkaliphila]GFP42043.1 [ribosomal protein S18]-alanine N-acetyltransferase [Candidatus Hakubella thermalkaliphila]